MDKSKIYSKTGKGVLEVKNKSGKLPKDLARTLALIDGKSPMSDLLDRTRLSEAEIDKIITQLIDAGYIKEFANSSRASGSSPAGNAYVDDLDFTSSLSSGKSVYQNAQSEWRQRETADRTKAEEEENRKRAEAERLKKEQAQRQLRAEAQRLATVEAERKAKEAAAMKLREEAERKAKLQGEMMAQTQRDMQKVLEAERKAFEQAELKRQQEQQEKGRAEGSNLLAREEEARKAREEEERLRKEEEDRRKRDDEERRRREDEERSRKELEERRRKEEEERRRKEEEERRRCEAELLKLREEEERKRREAEEISRKRREEEDRLRREEENRRLRREEEERHQKEADERRRQEEQRARPKEEAPQFDLGQIDMSGLAGLQVPAAKTDLPSLDLSGMQAVESQISSEFEKQQEQLRRREEEEERQREAAERARMEEERANREEYAREEAARRQMEDQERRERMEREREEREDRERKREEEKEQRIREQEETRKKAALDRERQEAGRLENERRSREDALKNRRKEQEERDRIRATVDTLKKTRAVKTPLDRLKTLVIGMVVIAGIAIGGIQLAPLNVYIPAVEKLATEHIKEPVSIGSMKLSVLNGLSLILENVRLGATQDLKIGKVSLSTSLGSVFGEIKVVDVLTAESVSIAEEAMQRLPKWMEAAVANKSVQIGRVDVKSAKLESRSLQLPDFDATIQLSPDGTIRSGNVTTTDGKLRADFSPSGTDVVISVAASKGWTPPLGAPIELTELTARAVASNRRIKIESFEAYVYGGVAKGSALIQWGASWSVEGSLATERVGMQELIAVFSREVKATGQLESALRYSMVAPNLAALFDAPRLEGTFTLRKGDLDGVDLIRALQSGGRGAIQGGATRFEELSGSLLLANDRYDYRGLKLGAGLLSASGGFEISPAKDISGKVFVELRTTAAHMRGNFNIDGNLKAVVLFPN